MPKIGLLGVCLVLIAASAITIIAALGFTARRARAWLTDGGTLKTEKKYKRLHVVQSLLDLREQIKFSQGSVTLGCVTLQ